MTQTNNSNRVISNQQGVHENLETIVRKHFETDYKKPIAEHTQNAFDSVKSHIDNALIKDTPLLFDSLCGTGVSTALLAKKNPSALVIGIDRSITRLSKTYNERLPDNAILVQAECADFWQLAFNEDWRLSQHSLYYPNPYPKAKHIKRRWHAHPSFPLLFKLGGVIELRTNWKIYADEFYQSFLYATEYLKNGEYQSKGVETIHQNITTKEGSNGKKLEPMTLFEKKYSQNGQKLYSCRLVSNL